MQLAEAWDFSGFENWSLNPGGGAINLVFNTVFHIAFRAYLRGAISE